MSLLSLGAVALWGMVLCFGYQLFWPLAEKSQSLPRLLLLYSGAGLLCFLLTALFLYAVNGGEWGIYGFLALLFGFGVYHRFCRSGGRRLARGAETFLGSLGRGGVTLGQKLADGVALPFGKIVDKGVSWAEKIDLKKEKEEDHGDLP